MFFKAKSLFFLGLVVSSISGLSTLNAHAPYLEQAFLMGYGLATRWGAHQTANITMHALADAIPQETKDALRSFGQELSNYTHAITFDSTGAVVDRDFAQKMASAAKYVVDSSTSFAADMTPVLVGINIAIVLWVAMLFVYEKGRALTTGADVPFKVEGSPVAQLIRNAHIGGMDAYWFGVTLQSLGAALEKLSEMPHAVYQKALEKTAHDSQEKDAIMVVPIVDEIKVQYAQALAMFVTGLVIGYASFNLMSVPLALKATQSMGEETLIQRFRKNAFFTAIVFNVGIVLAAAKSRILFALGEAMGLLKDCYACKATYQAGEDAAYVVSDVLGGWYNIYLQEVKMYRQEVKPKKD